MKTSKETSKEIMEKIEERKFLRMQIHKRVRRVCAAAIVFGFLIPTTLFSITEDFNPNRPLSQPFEQEEEKKDEEEQNPDSEMQKDGNNKFEIVLPM